MVNLFTQRDDTIMTTRTDPAHIRIEVIKDTAGEVDEIRNVMTIRTVTRRRHMITALSGTDRAVVTRCTVTRNTGVVEDRTHKGVGANMAVGAILVTRRSRNMINRFASTDHIVVASRAAANNTTVIINARGEATRRVTDAAVFGGRHMVSRLTQPCTIPGIAMTF